MHGLASAKHWHKDTGYGRGQCVSTGIKICHGLASAKHWHQDKYVCIIPEAFKAFNAFKTLKAYKPFNAFKVLKTFKALKPLMPSILQCLRLFNAEGRTSCYASLFFTIFSRKAGVRVSGPGPELDNK